MNKLPAMWRVRHWQLLANRSVAAFHSQKAGRAGRAYDRNFRQDLGSNHPEVATSQRERRFLRCVATMPCCPSIDGAY